MSDDTAPRWRTLSSREIYSDSFISLRVDHALTPGGTEAHYSVVHFQRRAVGVLPLAEDGKVHLVGQHRYPLDRYSWEIPEGGVPEGVDRLEHCKIELREETGLAARSWRKILTLHTSNSSTDEEALIWLATGLERVGEPEPEPSEADMRQICIPFAEALDRVAAGEITDAMTVAAILRTHQMAVKGELEPELARAILAGTP